MSTSSNLMLSPKVKKFVQAQHWFQDLTTIGLE